MKVLIGMGFGVERAGTPEQIAEYIPLLVGSPIKGKEYADSFIEYYNEAHGTNYSTNSATEFLEALEKIKLIKILDRNMTAKEFEEEKKRKEEEKKFTKPTEADLSKLLK